MSCCGKGQSLVSSVVENGVKARYIGQNVGAKAIHGNDERVYRGGNNRLDRFQYLHPDDVELLKDSFEVIESPKAEWIGIDMATEGDKQVATPLLRSYPDAADLNPESIGVSDEQADQPRKRGTK